MEGTTLDDNINTYTDKVVPSRDIVKMAAFYPGTPSAYPVIDRFAIASSIR